VMALGHPVLDHTQTVSQSKLVWKERTRVIVLLLLAAAERDKRWPSHLASHLWSALRCRGSHFFSIICHTCGAKESSSNSLKHSTTSLPVPPGLLACQFFGPCHSSSHILSDSFACMLSQLDAVSPTQRTAVTVWWCLVGM